MSKIDSLIMYINEKLQLECKLQGSNIIELCLDSSNVEESIRLLRDDSQCKFRILTDVFAVDYPNRESRFEVIYMLLSIVYNVRVCCKVFLSENQPIPSLVKIFSTANWFEREAFDMYGIIFANHPDLRRILTDYGFKGNPMLKDFPLTGYEEVRYNLVTKKVAYEPVNLTQEFRSFDFLSPWKGTEYKE